MAGTQSNRVFVGNLNPEVSSEDLKAHMGAAGKVLFADILTDFNGQSKGFATVKYRTAEEAADAISSLSGSMLFDREIFVREDRGKGGKGGKGSDSKGKGGFGGSGKGKGKGYGSSDGCGKGYGKRDGDGNGFDASYGKGRGKGFGKYSSGDGTSQVAANQGRLLYAGNLPFSTTWQDVKAAFSEYGQVARVDIAQDLQGRSRGHGTVLFERLADAQAAIDAMNDCDFQGRRMFVRLDRRA
eukprot:CAMPEP_0176223712 /NCGR_PEP_ID=MMETSP0121_2-20121125/20884_1 /TAXON_ID=160619 /ORGANISM="Kryptoperidinium foliaceum, Strain CCMP 1326" /LENGTH=240 /DNA_ID=CAMNT_0017562951 /DNA_START=15 /DNA_END=737 /DNA_ORIENTATION=+